MFDHGLSMDNKELLDNGTPLDLNDEIKSLIAQRMEKGRVAYGHGILPNAGYDWVQEALEEALDLAIYVSAKLLEVRKKTTPL
jgi:hypothetical protein